MVAAAAIGIGIAGMAGGAMGAIGGGNEKKAAFLASQVESRRKNFLSSLDNDKKNFMAARKNAMRRFNNRAIEKASVEAYGKSLYDSRESFKARSSQLASQTIGLQSRILSEATGRNLRGGNVELMQTRAKQQAKEMRLNNRRQKQAEEYNASISYQNMLSQRDMYSYESANVFMPGSAGIEPGSNTLGMISGLLSGGASGAGAGASFYGNVK